MKDTAWGVTNLAHSPLTPCPALVAPAGKLSPGGQLNEVELDESQVGVQATFTLK